MEAVAQLLRRSAALPAHVDLNGQVKSTSIADQNGVSSFGIAERRRAYNFVQAVGGWSKAGGVRDLATMPTLTFDTLSDALPPPALLKMEVEGAEPLMLRGVARLLTQVKPVIYLEVGDQQAAEVAALLIAAGYKLYDGRLSVVGQSSITHCAFH